MLPLSPYRIKKVTQREWRHAFKDLQHQHEKDAIIPSSPFLILERYATILETLAEILIGLLIGAFSLNVINFIVVNVLHLNP